MFEQVIKVQYRSSLRESIFDPVPEPGSTIGNKDHLLLVGGVIHRVAQLFTIQIREAEHLGGTDVNGEELFNHFFTMPIALHLSGIDHQLLQQGTDLKAVIAPAEVMGITHRILRTNGDASY